MPWGIRAFASNLMLPGSLELVATLLADAQLVLAVLLVTDAGNLTALGANEIDVGGVDRSLLRNDAALLVGSVGLDGLLDDRNALDNDLVLGGESTQDNALLAAILTRENLDLIALLAYTYISPNYRVSGASETIFMYFLSRSSRATGPKIRVPTGEPSLLMTTQAFSSKRM